MTRQPSRVRTGVTALFLAACAFAPSFVASQTINPLAEQTPEIENRLRVTGTVRSGGAPVRDVRVFCRVRDMASRRDAGTEKSVTDEQGLFSLDLSRYAFGRYGLHFYTVSPRFVEHTQIVEVAKEELPKAVEFSLTPGTVARGVVVDEEGHGLDGVQIDARQMVPYKSSSGGAWEVFGLRAGQNQIQFELEGYSREFLTVATREPEVQENLRVVLRAAHSLEVVVHAPSGAPVPGAYVSLQRPGRSGYQRTQADDKGVASFKGVPEDLSESVLEGQATGYLPTQKILAEHVPEGGKVDLTLDAGVMISGKVTLPGGAPGAGCLVIAGAERSRSAPQNVADENGAFQLGPFPTLVELTLTALPPSAEPLAAVGDLALEEKSPGSYVGDVALWPRGYSSKFTGEMKDNLLVLRRRDSGRGGLSAEAIYKAPWDPQGRKLEGTIEVPGMKQSGKFRMRRSGGATPAGEWELVEDIGASQLAVGPMQVRVTTAFVPGMMDIELGLEESKGLAGRVVDGAGRPAVDGSVSVLDWNGTQVFQAEASVEAGGKFRLLRVPPGAFRVVAYSGRGRERLFSAPAFARGGVSDLLIQLGEAESAADPSDE